MGTWPLPQTLTRNQNVYAVVVLGLLGNWAAYKDQSLTSNQSSHLYRVRERVLTTALESWAISFPT